MNKDSVDGNLTDLPNQKYEKFFNKFSEINTVDVESWKPLHLVSYFTKKYQDTYNVSYKFKFNTPLPSNCFEMFQIKKLSNLLTKQPKLLKNYIDWIFENKIIKTKRRITSISFLTHEEFMFEYRDNVLMAGQKGEILDRSKVLPDNYREIFVKADIKINTYGDLAFLSQMNDQSPEIISAFNELVILGFNKDILSKIV